MLSIVSTPIGNLDDITLRALSKLRECDAIVCEDTRVTGTLLLFLNLPKKQLISFHGYSNPKKVDAIIDRLKQGQRLCLVSDAGTPCISDPGFEIISAARKADLAIEVVPGPSAFLAALSASGLPINRFSYLGFLPVKKGRKTLFESLKNVEQTIVFYESPHRISKTLSELSDILSSQPDRRIVIARELTKLYEEVISTSIGELKEQIKTMKIKGEFVVVLERKSA
ncbi:16S rRNA (cytidine(1402)-2'-O)-methyltransferase [Candidatus Peribacteria bacterium RIFCSPLOWO2_01_FULL_51_18]|nr:MAG: 16S rRNA (cytidine(1402)-2'-O)-methyltransferase [Candidatus Peribacteria bacterium RIFCSPHIGHO2_02_FULL_51_15]OGJ66491.1 MAG: 16S rRNA (cytidine(1402)-2'-O)-methyltransferase [Candidatus Peribacteria bacterium RIFCSPLOWO2_01_FULL_51_18]OGJ69346.1 MAG: 16S rRNA (cytidine(1402)-2'-O)-methyltransferase [Candidatus Peribacteria bacterium RIFCSPLOWO2_02_FULL_51_10]